jgi:hypothetical protein
MAACVHRRERGDAPPLPGPAPTPTGPLKLARAYDECVPVLTEEERHRLREQCRSEGRSPSFGLSLVRCHELDANQTEAWHVSARSLELGAPVFIR